MARWISRRIDLGPNSAGGAGEYGKTDAAVAAEAAHEILDADPLRRRLALVISVPLDALHAVRIAFGASPASERQAAYTLVPGAQIDTSQIAAALQPSGPVTAWSGPTLYLGDEFPPKPGRIVLDVTEILADS